MRFGAVFILDYGVFSGAFYSYWIRKQVFLEVFSSVFLLFFEGNLHQIQAVFMCILYFTDAFFTVLYIQNFIF